MRYPNRLPPNVLPEMCFFCGSLLTPTSSNKLRQKGLPGRVQPRGGGGGGGNNPADMAISAMEAATGIGMGGLGMGSSRPGRTASEQQTFDLAMESDGEEEDHHSATVVQAAFRGRRDRDRVNSVRSERNNGAALNIQKNWAGKQARGKTAVLRAEKAEASRKATADVLSHQISASTKLQAVYRGHRVRTVRGTGADDALEEDDEDRRKEAVTLEAPLGAAPEGEEVLSDGSDM